MLIKETIGKVYLRKQKWLINKPQYNSLYEINIHVQNYQQNLQKAVFVVVVWFFPLKDKESEPSGRLTANSRSLQSEPTSPRTQASLLEEERGLSLP